MGGRQTQSRKLWSLLIHFEDYGNGEGGTIQHDCGAPPLHPHAPLIQAPLGCFQHIVMGLCQVVVSAASSQARAHALAQHDC